MNSSNTSNERVKEQSSVKIPETAIRISSHDRVLVAGKTGSGKSTLTMFMLATLKRLVVIDSKDGLQDWFLDDFNRSTINRIKNGEAVRIRVVKDEDALEVLRAAYEGKDIVVYIDEVTALIPPQSKPDQVFVDIWQRGRSRGVGAWAATQRPSGIPLIFMSEAEHFFIFRLNLDEDRKRLASFAGQEVREPVRDKYGFFYYNTNSGRAVYYRQMNIK